MNGDQQPTLAEPNLLHSIWNHKLLVLGSIVVFALLGVLVISVRPTKYVADSGVVLQDPLATVASVNRTTGDEVRYVADQVAILKSSGVAERASLDAKKGPDPRVIDASVFQRDVSVVSTSDSNFVLVRFQASDPRTAAVGANAVVRAYRDLISANLKSETDAKLHQLDAAIAGAEARLARDPSGASVLLRELRSRRSLVQVDSELAGDGVALASPASKGKPEGFSLLSALAIGVVLGGLIGAGLAYWLDARRKAFSGVFQPQRLLEAPALAEIPDFTRAGVGSMLPVLHAPGTEAAEAFRLLASGIGVPGVSIGRPHEAASASSGRDGLGATNPVIAFVSSSFGAGTTTLVANTAIAAAQEGLKVLAIDADVGMRDLTRLLSDEEAQALDGGPWHASAASSEQNIRRVMMLPGGGTVSLLGPTVATRRRSDVIRAEQILPTPDLIRDQFDMMLVDVPAILNVAYADALLRSAESVVFVVPHRSPEALLKRSLDRLDLLGVRPLGYVYNLAPSRQHTSRRVTDEMRGRAERLVVELGERAKKVAAR